MSASLATRAWRLATSPVRFVRTLVGIPRAFRERLFVKGQGSDTGNVSPSP